MTVFPCKNCDNELDSIINFFAKTVREEGFSEDLKEVKLSGHCPKCEAEFSFGGKMFAHILATRATEGWDVGDVGTNGFIDLNEEESVIVDMLIEEERYDELEAFIRNLLQDGDE